MRLAAQSDGGRSTCTTGLDGLLSRRPNVTSNTLHHPGGPAGERVDMASIRALLDGVGVVLDPAYGPVPINPQLGRYVVRGTASPDARTRAEQIPGVRFFADAVQEPAS